MKTLKHIWKYLTKPEYRSWVDFCTQKEHLNKSMNLILDNLELASRPMFICDGGKIKRI